MVDGRQGYAILEEDSDESRDSLCAEVLLMMLII
jgi:hypothetical protein